MTAFHYDDSKGAEFFAGHVERIYALFAPLSAVQVEQLRLWYIANNDVERVCANDNTISLKRYADFPAELTDLRDQLASFFKGLYSHLDVAALKKWCGHIDDHYQTFVQTNKAGKCPFCGINDLLGEYHSKREAYDHYLPKALYPFNSINFRNLVPACHHCNSSYKTSKNPAYSLKDPARAVHRRPVFYPYKTTPHSVELQIDLQHSDIAKLTPADITLQFGPAAITQELGTWNDVYGIEERYKSKLCTESDGKAWLGLAWLGLRKYWMSGESWGETRKSFCGRWHSIRKDAPTPIAIFSKRHSSRPAEGEAYSMKSKRPDADAEGRRKSGFGAVRPS